MSTFLRFLGKYKAYVILSIGFMLIELTLEVAQPLLMSRVIDDGIMAGDMYKVMLWGGILIAATLVAFGIGIISSFYSAYVSQNFGFDLRKGLYEVIQRMSYQMFARFQEASLLTRVGNDVNQVQNAVFMGMRIMLRAPLLVISSIVMALFLNWKLAIFLLITLPILVVFLGWLMNRNNRLFRVVQQKLDEVNSVMQQGLMSIRLIRVFGRMKEESEQYQVKNEELRKKTVSTMILAELSNPIVITLIYGSILLMLWVARELLIQGSNISVGEIVAIVNYAMRMAGALSMVAMIVNSIARATASMQRIDEVFDSADQEQDTVTISKQAKTAKIQGEILFQNVSFSYPESSVQTLININLSVSSGELIAIMGATGAGKSSLLQLISRLYEVDAGHIYIDHKLIKNYSLRQLRMNIGYVPQEMTLFTGTITDNIRWGKLDATLDEIIEAAKLAQIHDTIMELPHGYDTVIGQKGVNLSGGQKQRVSIARALVRKPAILLLDDCTSALDVATERRLLDAITSMKCTVLLITQKMSTTIRADSIVIMDEGRVMQQGNHEELLVSCELYRKIVESQWGKEDIEWTSTVKTRITNPS